MEEETKLVDVRGTAEAVAPHCSTPDWRNLCPKLAHGIVRASGAVRTVAKNARSGEGYMFASTAAVVDEAGVAMSTYGLSMPVTGYQVREGWMYAKFVIVFADGETCSSSPDIDASMPMASVRDKTKAVGATLSYMRKYVSAMILGIGWDDPSECVDSQGSSKPAKNPKMPAPRQAPNAAPKREQEQEQEPDYVQAARHAGRVLKDSFGYASVKDAYRVASGRDWPADPREDDFKLLVGLAELCDSIVESGGGAFPATHEQFIEARKGMVA